MHRMLTLAVTMVELMPGAAWAQGFPVAMGQELTITLGDAPAVTGMAVAAPNAFEIAVGKQFMRGDHDEAIGPAFKPMRGATPEVMPGMLRVRLTPVAGKKPGSLLVFANGYDRALAYRAQIKVRGKEQPTDVCIVMPGKTGIEYWPYEVELIRLGDLRLEPW